MLTIKSDKYELPFGPQKKPVEVTVSIQYDEEPVIAEEVLFDNEAQVAAFREEMESGRSLCISVLVRASALGMVGIDSISQCFVSATDFENEIEAIVFSHLMERNAIEALKEEILEKYIELHKVMGEKND